MLVDYSDNESTDGNSSDAGSGSASSVPEPRPAQTAPETPPPAAEWVLPPPPPPPPVGSTRCSAADRAVYDRVAHLLHVQATTGRCLSTEITRAPAYGDPRLFEKLLPRTWPTVSQRATLLHDAPDPDVLQHLAAP